MSYEILLSGSSLIQRSTCTNTVPQTEDNTFTIEKLKAAIRSLPPAPPRINIMVGCPYFNGKIEYRFDTWYYLSHDQYNAMVKGAPKIDATYQMLTGGFSNGLHGMRIWYWNYDQQTLDEQDAFYAFMANALMLLFAAIAGLLGGMNLAP